MQVQGVDESDLGSATQISPSENSKPQAPEISQNRNGARRTRRTGFLHWFLDHCGHFRRRACVARRPEPGKGGCSREGRNSLPCLTRRGSLLCGWDSMELFLCDLLVLLLVGFAATRPSTPCQRPFGSTSEPASTVSPQTPASAA